MSVVQRSSSQISAPVRLEARIDWCGASCSLATLTLCLDWPSLGSPRSMLILGSGAQLEHVTTRVALDEDHALVHIASEFVDGLSVECVLTQDGSRCLYVRSNVLDRLSVGGARADVHTRIELRRE